MKNRPHSKIMPCQTIILESQFYEPGKRVTLDVTDMYGKRSAHKQTAAPVTEIKLWPEGDIQELNTELGTYSGTRKVDKFDRGNMPMAVVHYYNEAGSGILRKQAYHLAKPLMADLRNWYREHGSKDIMVYADHDDLLTIQRITNVCLTTAGVIPCICSLRHAAAEQDFDLM